jgi:hypothetical protein
MIPEAVEGDHKATGLLAVAGLLVAFSLSAGLGRTGVRAKWQVYRRPMPSNFSCFTTISAISMPDASRL